MSTTAPARSRARRRRSAADLSALGVWALSRGAVVLLTVVGAWWLGGGGTFLQRWDRWDVGLFRKIAEFGYAGYPRDYPDVGIEAFFPGLPLVLRAVHAVVPDWTAAGLLVSLVAGAAASVALGRLAVLDGAPPSRAVLYLVLSPYAVFLFAGYSEALFLALALWGWLCARQEQWALASLLVAASATVRISGLLLACGLVVHHLVVRRGRLRRDALWLLAPFAAVASYAAYLAQLTGDWMRWRTAQSLGWGRELTAPWDALALTVRGARDGDFTWSFRGEILAAAVGLALVVVLAVRRRWGEATYVALSLCALVTSTFYLSVGRATLLWWSLPVLLATASATRPWLHRLLVVVLAPLMAVGVLTFTAGRWVG